VPHLDFQRRDPARHLVECRENRNGIGDVIRPGRKGASELSRREHRGYPNDDGAGFHDFFRFVFSESALVSNSPENSFVRCPNAP
jgi:hypothetical protein